jgi:hypothetical protein
MQNSIGTHEFLHLHGHIEPPRKSCLVLARAGVEGNSAWLDVKHGVPFRLRSVVDCADIYEGRVFYNNYLEAIGGNPVDVVWEDQSADDEGFKCVVLDVKLIDLHLILNSVGGFSDYSTARLECEWMLVSILNSVP